MSSRENDWVYANEMSPDGPLNSFRIEAGHQKDQPHNYKVDIVSLSNLQR